MRPNAVQPTGVERRFGTDELIVSKTDIKGIITYANEVFVRVSGYPEQRLLGAPHSIVRHPEMPRAVFKLMWDTIEAGNEIFAYVLNLAADGAHYWVFAHITPSFGPGRKIVGYHSNRRSPQAAAVETIRPVYAALLAEERRHPTGSAALAASTAALGALLAERGQSYDRFVWSITSAPVVPAPPTSMPVIPASPAR